MLEPIVEDVLGLFWCGWPIEMFGVAYGAYGRDVRLLDILYNSTDIRIREVPRWYAVSLRQGFTVACVVVPFAS
jgi:hypothetical protein